MKRSFVVQFWLRDHVKVTYSNSVVFSCTGQVRSLLFNFTADVATLVFSDFRDRRTCSSAYNH